VWEYKEVLVPLNLADTELGLSGVAEQIDELARRAFAEAAAEGWEPVGSTSAASSDFAGRVDFGLTGLGTAASPHSLWYQSVTIRLRRLPLESPRTVTVPDQ
jgi:hypothetical protein